MARSFDYTVPEALHLLDTVVSSYPFTFACWAYVNAMTTDDAGLMIRCNYSLGGSGHWDVLRVNDTSGLVEARSWSGGTTANAQSTAAISTGTWFHACGVFAANNDRRSYLNGGNKGTSSATQTPTNLERFYLGPYERNPSEYGGWTDVLDGALAECAVWNVALTDAEVAALATGIRPTAIRPSGLVLYAPLWRDEDEDFRGGRSFILDGTPSIAVHPRVFAIPSLAYVPNAAGGGDLSASASDGATIGESVTVDVSDPQVTTSDGLAVGESVAMSGESFVAVEDGLTIGESVEMSGDSFVAVSDGLTVSDSPAIDPLELAGVSVSDNVVLEDTPNVSLGVLADLDVNVSDGVTIGESVQRLLESFVGVSDGLAVADATTIDPLILGDVSVSDALIVGESATLNVSEADMNVNHGVDNYDNWVVGVRIYTP